MGVQCEGVQRAHRKFSVASAEAKSPCNRKKTSTGETTSPLMLVTPIWRDNVQVVDKAAWGASCGNAKVAVTAALKALCCSAPALCFERALAY